MEIVKTDTLVIGGGPAGYVAGIRLGQLGIDAVLVENIRVGGVCLNRGCIPSKVLISAARRYLDVKNGSDFGLEGFENLTVNLEKLQNYKNKVVKKLTSGVASLLKHHKTRVLNGTAGFKTENTAEVVLENGEKVIVEFKHAIIASGSRPKYIPGMEPDGKVIINSTQALDLTELPESMAVVGGGVIGLELGSFYAALGTEVTVIEAMPQIMPGTSLSLVKILMRSLKKRGMKIYTDSKVSGISVNENEDKAEVSFETPKGGVSVKVEKVLMSIGRKPDLTGSGLENLGFDVSSPYLETDEYMRTKIPHIYAAGDITGQPLLAHRASAQAEVAVENIAGANRIFNPLAIPAVSYTDPEVATVGMSVARAEEKGIAFKTGKFKFAASGRALAAGHTDGYLEIITDENEVIIGVEIVGPEASELISEGVIAVEKQLKASDLANAVHAHPTLGEVMMEAAKDVRGEAIHQISLKK